jgi:hypothetical protein
MIMRLFNSAIKHSVLKIGTLLTALLVGMTFALTTSEASAAVVKDVKIDTNPFTITINKVKIPIPPTVVTVKLPAIKVGVQAVEQIGVKPESKSRFVRPFGIGPFFNEDLFGFED